MSTFLIETTEEDSFLAVARYVGKLLNGDGELNSELAATPGNKLVQDARQFVASQQHSQLLALLLQHVDLILQQSEGASTECCLNVICHLVPRVEPPSASIKMAIEFVDALRSSTTHRPAARMQAMLELFNTLTLPEAQHEVLLKGLAFAKEANIHQLAAPLHGKAELWERQWGLPPAAAMTLYAAIAAVLDLDGNPPNPVYKKEAYFLRTKVLLACPAKDAAAVAALKPLAHDAALSFIASPSIFHCDMFASPAVKALKDDKQFGKTYELLAVMLSGSIRDFKAGGFEAVLKSARVSYEDCVDKMRLMALLSLGSTKEGMDISFLEMEKAMDLEAGEAEAWLVRAFGKQLLDGRIDQVKECVRVRRCERRVFEGQDWKKLKTDLENWKANLGGIAVAMKEQNLLNPTSTVQPWLSS